MSMRDLLSQDEVDALLVAIQNEHLAERAEAEPEALERYDLAREQLRKKQCLPGLEQWHRRFADTFRESLSQSLNREVDISLADTQLQSCGDYLHSLCVPTSLNLMRIHPLPASGMFVLDGALVFRLVDVFFGGGLSIAQHQERAFSLSERRIIGRVISIAHRDFESSAKKFAELHCQPLGSELNPSLVSLAAASEALVVSRFQLDIDGCGGELQVALPLKMLEPLREALASSGGGQYRGEDSSWGERLSEALLDTPVATRYRLEKRTVKLADVVSLKVGDILPISGRSAAMLSRGKAIRALHVETGGSKGDQLRLTIASK